MRNIQDNDICPLVAKLTICPEPVIYTDKEMIRGAGPGFGSNCRRYFFITNNETHVLGFLWMGLFSEIQAILCLKWTIFDKNGVSFFSNSFLNISLI